MTNATKGSFFERRFKLKENGTDVRTEIMAGITTFMTMSYILAVNPAILGDAGMDKGGVFTATVLASVIATLLMAFLANLPFALSAGMGLNAFFTYTVVMQMGKSLGIRINSSIFRRCNLYGSLTNRCKRSFI